jgi:hypothetical protein
MVKLAVIVPQRVFVRAVCTSMRTCAPVCALEPKERKSVVPT